VRLGAPINLPNEDKSLSAEQMHRWRQLSGTTAHKWVSKVIETPEYRETDDEGRKRIIAKVMGLARAYTKENVLTGQPIPTDEPDRRPNRAGRQADESGPPSLGDMGDWELVE
jgi:hypothetical protein